MILHWASKIDKNTFYSTTAILIYLAVLKLIIPLLTHPDFELHRDEFLYWAMAEHLGWGYLEVPPAIAVFAWISKHLIGTSIYAVRFLPALSGAITLLLIGFVCRELGGGRFAQILAAISYLVSLVFLRINLLFQPVTFNLLFYMLAAYLFIRILKENKPRDWMLLGITMGLGLLNKYTMLLPAFGMAVGLALTPYRKYYLNKWLWISTLIALIIWLPNLIWQHSNGWPFLTHMLILSATQLTNVQPHLFIFVQLLLCFYAAPVWMIGYLYLQFARGGKQFRPLAYMYLSTFAVLFLLSGKAYYLAPAYSMLIAAGSMVIEKYIIQSGRKWIGWILCLFIITGSSTLIPVGLPVLSVQGMTRYFELVSEYMGIDEAVRWETGELRKLPQDYADMLGWESMAVRIAETYHGLSAEDKERCTVFASNYGRAGCISYYAEQYRMPSAISQNGSFWLWGPGEYGGEVLIIAGLNRQEIGHYFNSTERKASFRYPYARESGMPILVARDLNMDVDELWQILKQYRY